MKVFTTLYEKSLQWAQHRYANLWLGIVSFTESCVFIIPPDIMIPSMVLAKPARWIGIALLTTITSVLGGLFGYLIGLILIDEILPFLEQWEQLQTYQQAHEWFEEYGSISILAASFLPIPYKMFTISAGALNMNIGLFIIMSLIGRGTRYFLVAGLVRYFGQALVDRLGRYLDLVGWCLVILLIGYLFYKYVIVD